MAKGVNYSIYSLASCDCGLMGLDSLADYAIKIFSSCVFSMTGSSFWFYTIASSYLILIEDAVCLALAMAWARETFFFCTEVLLNYLAASMKLWVGQLDYIMM